MAEDYIKNIIEEAHLPTYIDQTAQQVQLHTQTTIADSISKTIDFGSKSLDINAYLEQHYEALRLKGNVEANIASTKLKEAEKSKAELAKKLESIQESIKEMELQKNASQPKRATLMNSSTREKFKIEEKRKLEEAEELTRKMNSERAKILQEKKEYKRLMRERQIKAKEKAARRQKELEDKRAAEKAEQLTKLQEAARLRNEEKEKRQKLLEEDKKAKKDQLMHKKIEKQFMRKVLMPELEARKRELEQKREIFKPLNHDEIEEHAQRYSEQARQNELKRREKERFLAQQLSQNQLSLPKYSKFTEQIISQQESQREEQFKKQEQRRELLKKQRTYAELVKQVHKPTIDEQKSLQVKANIAKAGKSSIKGASSSSRIIKQLSSDDLFKTPKFKPNPMAPKPKQPRTSKAVDYLAQRRSAREDYENELAATKPMQIDLEYEFYAADNLDQNEAQRILKKADQVEKDARRKEVILREADFSNPTAIKTSDETADALISSVKAKLKLLEVQSNGFIYTGELYHFNMSFPHREQYKIHQKRFSNGDVSPPCSPSPPRIQQIREMQPPKINSTTYLMNKSHTDKNPFRRPKRTFDLSATQQYKHEHHSKRARSPYRNKGSTSRRRTHKAPNRPFDEISQSLTFDGKSPSQQHFQQRNTSPKLRRHHSRITSPPSYQALPPQTPVRKHKKRHRSRSPAVMVYPQYAAPITIAAPIQQPVFYTVPYAYYQPVYSPQPVYQQYQPPPYYYSPEQQYAYQYPAQQSDRGPIGSYASSGYETPHQEAQPEIDERDTIDEYELLEESSRSTEEIIEQQSEPLQPMALQNTQENPTDTVDIQIDTPRQAQTFDEPIAHIEETVPDISNPPAEEVILDFREPWVMEFSDPKQASQPSGNLVQRLQKRRNSERMTPQKKEKTKEELVAIRKQLVKQKKKSTGSVPVKSDASKGNETDKSKVSGGANTKTSTLILDIKKQPIVDINKKYNITPCTTNETKDIHDEENKTCDEAKVLQSNITPDFPSVPEEEVILDFREPWSMEFSDRKPTSQSQSKLIQRLQKTHISTKSSTEKKQKTKQELAAIRKQLLKSKSSTKVVEVAPSSTRSPTATQGSTLEKTPQQPSASLLERLSKGIKPSLSKKEIKEINQRHLKTFNSKNQQADTTANKMEDILKRRQAVKLYQKKCTERLRRN